MRTYGSMDGLLQQVEFFVDAVSDYEADFVVFPEFFNAPLMIEFNQLDPAAAIRGLAKYTEPLREKFSEFAVSYNVNIITGSMPIVIDDLLYNISYLCRRDGTGNLSGRSIPRPAKFTAGA